MSIDTNAFSHAAAVTAEWRSQPDNGPHFSWEMFRIFTEAYEAAKTTEQPVELTERIAEALWLHDKRNNNTWNFQNPFAGRTWSQMEDAAKQEEEIGGSIHRMIHREERICYLNKAKAVAACLPKREVLIAESDDTKGGSE